MWITACLCYHSVVSVNLDTAYSMVLNYFASSYSEKVKKNKKQCRIETVNSLAF